MAAEEPEVQSGLLRSYGVVLYYRDAPALAKPKLLEALQARVPDVLPLDGDAESDLLAFVYSRHLSSTGQGRVPAQCLLQPEATPPEAESLVPVLRQTWLWREGPTLLPLCHHRVELRDFMAAGLGAQVRLELFQRTLHGVLEAAPAVALHWLPTQQLVDPAQFAAAMESGGFDQLLPGAVNVRFYRAQAPDGGEAMLMDTVGLAAIGLADLQCYFRELPAEEVRRVLLDGAGYLFRHGLIVRQGDQLPGIGGATDPWDCEVGLSFVPPERLAVTLLPAAPHNVVPPTRGS